MSRSRNAAEVAGMGAAFGFAFLGAEELLSLLLRLPALSFSDLALLLPIYVGLGGALGLLLGVAGVQGIAASLWLWAAFSAFLLGGPLGAMLGGLGAPAPLGLALGAALMLVVVVGVLFVTRDSDDYRWGALAGGWAATVFAGVVNEKVGGSSAPVVALINVGVVVIGVTLALAFGKALDGRTPKAGAWALVLGVLLWALRVPALNLVEVELAKAPNKAWSSAPVLLVVVSGLRADNLSFFGGDGDPTTPALDELARSSITYEQAHAAAPWGPPAMASLYTGQLPRKHGVGQPAEDGARSSRLGQEQRTLAEYLDTADVRTVSLVSDPVYAPGSGFEQGFDHAERIHGLGRTPLVLPTLDVLNVKLFPSRAYPTAAQVVDRAVATMGALGQSGWWLSLQLSDLKTVPGSADPLGAYKDTVRAVDAELGRLLAAAPKSAWIIVVGDHGQSFGEHADAYPDVQRAPGTRFGDTLYQELLHVPLIVHRPRNLRPVSVLRPVRSADLMPTLMELFQQRALTSLDAEVLHEALGRAPPAEEVPVVSEAVRYGPTRTAVRRAEWKLIESADSVELYNLALDPREEMDISDQHPALVKDLGYELPGRYRPQEQARPPIELLLRFGEDAAPEDAEGEAAPEGAAPGDAAPGSEAPPPAEGG